MSPVLYPSGSLHLCTFTSAHPHPDPFTSIHQTSIHPQLAYIIHPLSYCPNVISRIPDQHPMMFPHLIRTSGPPIHVSRPNPLSVQIPVLLHLISDIWTPDLISTSPDLRIQPMLHIRTQTLNQRSSSYGNHLSPDFRISGSDLHLSSMPFPFVGSFSS
ncbi:hypothetical protein C8R48DRAFT_774799 [Suillus tomentosus]|nr:hypothetical protein C8R48DRAFT_774799 [Suillus tomentosus]